MPLKFQLPIKFEAKPENTPGLPAVTVTNNRPARNEIGAPGQMISSGRLGLTEYNPDLQPPASYDTYDRMRKSDGTVRGLMAAIKLPILNVDWRVVPGSEDEADVAIANYIQGALDNMSTGFDNLLYQILLYLDYGSYPFEIVWNYDEASKLITLRKLAPRSPKTIIHWNVDEHGGLKSVTQVAYKASTIEQPEIPVEKLVVFVNDQEGADWRGNSVLRYAYKHWFFKDKMYILDAIAKERRSIGIDVGTLKGHDVDDDDEADLGNALLGLHAHEKQFMIEQEERFTYRIEGLNGRPLPLLDSIEHHDLLILRAMLAEFIALGNGSGGSFALSKDKSSFFVMLLNSIAKYVCAILNKHLIRKWVDYNWSVTNYPKLVYSRIETRDVASLAESIGRLEEAGFLKPTAADEGVVRDMLEFPHVVRPEGTSASIPLSAADLTAITALFVNIGSGAISPEQARGILAAAFPYLTTDQIDAMLVGAGTNGNQTE